MIKTNKILRFFFVYLLFLDFTLSLNNHKEWDFLRLFITCVFFYIVLSLIKFENTKNFICGKII